MFLYGGLSYTNVSKLVNHSNRNCSTIINIYCICLCLCILIPRKGNILS
nr:MAG TPA: hypothetical protein [Crassvirales sp.]